MLTPQVSNFLAEFDIDNNGKIDFNGKMRCAPACFLADPTAYTTACGWRSVLSRVLHHHGAGPPEG
eukprot:scaffold731_cov261-Pinguiococcus_pyrenoidosus.AAC.17